MPADVGSAAGTPAQVRWYFDFISPFAYLAFEALPQALAAVVPAPQIDYRPVLFAGLLDHWGHKGPAEIGPKRRFTYEHVAWLAARHGIPMQVPRHHPFNPLPLLRAAIAAGGSRAAIERLFRFVWREGRLPDEPGFAAVLGDLGISAAALEAPAVKQALRDNGALAIAEGVFGVPTAVATTPRGSRLVWGFDALPMLADWLNAAPLFDSDALRRAATLPTGVKRPGA
ncbi:MAG: 2-hydroxychromene-2-carboxylate isomerase [Betaproteobacteria bacterium]|jgi:2-hydroxychromene-2-carboxylate isomerase